MIERCRQTGRRCVCVCGERENERDRDKVCLYYSYRFRRRPPHRPTFHFHDEKDPNPPAASAKHRGGRLRGGKSSAHSNFARQRKTRLGLVMIHVKTENPLNQAFRGRVRWRRRETWRTCCWQKQREWGKRTRRGRSSAIRDCEFEVGLGAIVTLLSVFLLYGVNVYVKPAVYMRVSPTCSSTPYCVAIFQFVS